MQDHSKKEMTPRSGSSAQSDQRDAISGTIETKPTFDNLKRKASDDFGNVKDKAKEQLQEASGKVEEVASKQKNIAARYAASIGTALEKVGAEMQSGDDAPVGRYAKELGSTVKSYAKDIEDRELSEVANLAEDFGRRQPLAFLGVAALAGLVASRFLTASAHRGPTTQSTGAAAHPADASSQGDQWRSNAND
jgi:ElaB/YqjD/DUF883 family membrane-anchored ribosome-binding protein